MRKYTLFDMELSLQSIHKKVKEIIEEASTIAREDFDRKKEITFKKGVNITTQIVTETDKKLDALLRQRLQKEFPDFGFIDRKSVV